MKRANKFSISKSWLILLRDIKIDPVDVLAYSQLPADLFNQPEIVLTPAEYFKLWEGIEAAAGGEDVALLLAEHLNVESFDPAIFACICSPDLNTALKRLQQYKPLIGPMILDVAISATDTRLSIECYGYEGELPTALCMTELIFFTQLSRLATRNSIAPLAVQLPVLPRNLQRYTDYFGCDVAVSDAVAVIFSAADAAMPFMTSNIAMWEFFEDKLNQRLQHLDVSASTVDRVRAALIENLAAGEVSMEQIAKKLAMSKRTLQRRLTEEAETFQSVLRSVRTELADHYLNRSPLSLSEISFLLGFEEPNSFIRAYKTWTGMSPGQYRGGVQ